MARRRADSAIAVDGLPELVKALRDVDPALERELRRLNKDIATFVASDARQAAEALGGVARHVAPSIKPTAGAGYAGVALGGGSYPMAGGAEFGSYRYKQFQPWRGNGSDAGYFLYPAIRRDSDRIDTEARRAMDRMIQKAGLET